MDRRDTLAALALVAAPVAAMAQNAERVRKVGVLWSTALSNPATQRDAAAMLDGLREKGWVEGKNLQVDMRWSQGDPVRARTLAAELAGTAPDLIFSSGTVALVGLRDAKVKLPIVFVNITDPVAGGFVASLAHPGGNITGFTPFEYDIGGKWLQLLKNTVPTISHATLLGDPANHNFAGFVRSFTAAAKSLNVKPTSAAIRNTDDIRRAIEAEAGNPNGGLIVTAATFTIVSADMIFSLASKYRLPAIYWNSNLVQSGGLMSYGPDSNALHHASADYVDRVLKGAKPEDLAVQSPNKIDLTVNLKTAKALGITIPQTVLVQANEVIQ
jgi:putative ABC transport system substrate-binding protein